MLLSFSVPRMVPMIRAGIAQHRGETLPAGTRVKRQTIRPLGPRTAQLLKHDPIGHTQPYDLHCWYKSRTPDRAFLGLVAGGSRVYHLEILHGTVTPPTGPEYPIIRIDGPHGWREGDPMIFWSEAHGGAEFEREAFADGFDSPQAFRDYFVPVLGQKFDGAIYKW